MKAEYVALSECTRKITRHCLVFEKVGLHQDVSKIFEDNAYALKWATGNVAEDFPRSEHVDTRYLHVRRQVNKEIVTLEKIDRKHTVYDLLSKLLGAAEIELASRTVEIYAMRNIQDKVKAAVDMKVGKSVENERFSNTPVISKVERSRILAEIPS